MAPAVSESDHFDDICHWGRLGGSHPFTKIGSVRGIRIINFIRTRFILSI